MSRSTYLLAGLVVMLMIAFAPVLTRPVAEPRGAVTTTASAEQQAIEALAAWPCPARP